MMNAVQEKAVRDQLANLRRARQTLREAKQGINAKAAAEVLQIQPRIDAITEEIAELKEGLENEQ